MIVGTEQVIEVCLASGPVYRAMQSIHRGARGSWVGPSEFPGGITNHQWENMYGGDGFWMFADPTDPDYLYAESQGGYIGRVNRKTHESRGIQPLPHYNEKKLRFNWN